MSVRIYHPAKTAMQSGQSGQSGRAKNARWILEYETAAKREPDSLMGWTGAEDTLGQVRLRFNTREAAVAFANKKDWAYTVQEPHQRKIKARNYGDNFRYVPVEE